MESQSGRFVTRSHSPQSPPNDPDDMPACQSCRKRKLKCNRELPSCSQCSRLSCDCIYAGRKQKPGLRSGAIDGLNRRIETLERLLLDTQSRATGTNHLVTTPNASDVQGCLYHAALLIANQIKKSTNTNGIESLHNAQSNIYCDAYLVENGLQRGQSQQTDSRKRKHQDISTKMPKWDHLDESPSPLPDSDVLEQIVDAYFSTVHHWMPFIHQRRFRARLLDPIESKKMTVLLHGLTVVAFRQVKTDRISLDEAAMEEQICVSRNVVMLNAMDGLSIENLQALALVAFDRMGSANTPRAWAIVGSLVKSVEYLQLTVEPDDVPRHSFMRPLALLPPTQSPGEEEERRRVFWNIFLLDRFLSVTSGWNPSITSQDAHRRLPSNGKTWNSNERAATPFFGILDRSTSKIGSMMPYVGLHGTPSAEPNPQSLSPGCGVRTDEAANLGALAFRIEATESLSQVISCFLLQEFNFRDRDEVSKWLARFKELDLRLVHWKLFFAKRWSDSNVSSEQTPIEMDPNLTLAHLTHNASMILLHQHIAYPSRDLTNHVKLPTACSAETCQLAAAEIASIIGKFLSHISYLVPAQFAFCAFIAARIMLVHWRFYDAQLRTEFSVLISYLRDMSRRWQGVQLFGAPQQPELEGLDIAARYATELEELHDQCLADPGLCTQILTHPFTTACNDADPFAIRHPDTGLFIGRGIDNLSPFSNEQYSPSVRLRQESNGTVPHERMTPAVNMSYDASNLAVSDTSKDQLARINGEIIDELPMGLDTESLGDELAAVSHTLLDQQFAEMDRVFTLSGTDFTFGIGSWDAVPLS